MAPHQCHQNCKLAIDGTDYAGGDGAGDSAALAGDLVQPTETGSLTAAVDHAMVAEPQDQELTGSPDFDIDNRPPEGGSPVSDENNTDFAAVHSVLSAIDLRETSSD